MSPTSTSMPRALPVLLLAVALPAAAQTPYLTLAPLDLSAARFGEAVAAVPDTDGDGVPDLVVGAPNEELPGTTPGRGRVYVLSGATGALRFRIKPPDPDRTSDFGETVAGVPDADGDGLGDVLVGVPGYEVTGRPDRNTVGRAYLFSGATGVLLQTLDTPEPDFSNNFGAAVAGVPDLDDDGLADLAVGAPNEFAPQPLGSAYGRVYLFSSATGDTLRTISAPSVVVSNPGLAFGRAVAHVPDTNGDGQDDLAVGAPGFRAGPESLQRSVGRTYLFSGATGALLQTFDTPTPEFEGVFGTSVAGVPDADGDGLGDVLAGAPGEDAGGRTNAGRAHLFSGASGALLRTLASPDPRIGGGFGRAVAGVPDLDGDSRGDLAVGAPSEFLNVTPDPGRVHVVSGASGSLVATLRGPNRGNPIPVASFGWAVAGVEGLGGDGRGAVLVGSPAERVETTQTGLAFVHRPGGGTVGAEGPPGADALALSAAPVPASGAATLRFTLPDASAVRLTLHDALGRTVATLADGALAAGPHAIAVDAGRLAPGVYVARLAAAGGAATTRLVVAR